MEPMTMMMLGSGALSGASDIFGVISQMRQQARMKQIYDILRNPAALAGGANQLYTPLSDEAKREIMRYTQAEAGTRGFGDGQYASLHAARAFAPLEAQQRNAALNAYIQALTGAVGTVGTPAGTSGALGRSLQSMMLLSLLAGKGGGTPETGQARIPSGGITPSDFMSTPYQYQPSSLHQSYFGPSSIDMSYTPSQGVNLPSWYYNQYPEEAFAGYGGGG